MDPTRIPQSSEPRYGEWTEDEKIYLALQIHHQRNERHGTQVPASQVLLDHLGTYQVDWDNLPLPTGRTISQGKNFYHSHSRRSSGPGTAQSAGRSPGSFAIPSATAVGGASGAVISRKRSLPSDNLTPHAGRLIAPKQPHSYPAEGASRPSITGHYSRSPLVDPQPPTYYIESRKRRGRPTKKEQEERRRLMGERTQNRLQAQTPVAYSPSYAPPQLPSYGPVAPRPQPSLPTTQASSEALSGSPTSAIAQTPRRDQIETEQTSSGSSGSKRRKQRPPRLSTSEHAQVAPPPFNATAYSSPPQTGSHHERHSSTPALSSGVSAGPSHFDIQEQRPRSHAPEDFKPQHSRSRPWEAMGRSAP